MQVMWNTCGECFAHSEWLQYVSIERVQKKCHKLCLSIHLALCKKYGVRVYERWYEHKVESVIENDIVKILWDVCIQVNRQIEHWMPDIVVIEKNTKKRLIINIVCPVDNNLVLKRNEKLDNYFELRLEIARMWDKETLIVAIIIGALGSIPNDLECNLKKLVISYNLGILQKSVLVGTANILRKVLSIKQ